MGTKRGKEPSLKGQAKVSQIIKVAQGMEHSRQKENIYKGTEVRVCCLRATSRLLVALEVGVLVLNEESKETS